MTIEVHPLIDGRVRREGEGVVSLVDPADGTTFGTLADTPPALIDEAVASARAAFEAGIWRHRPPSERAAVMERVADAVAAAADELGALDSQDMGKPIGDAIGDVGVSAEIIRGYAQRLAVLSGDVFPSDHRSHGFRRYEAIGVVAAITPWNYPVPNLAHKLGPALAVGNSLIVKPSEVSSRSALRIAELAFEAGVPPSVLHIVTGRGEHAGDALARHGDVDLVTFTGSTAVGGRILAAAGQSNLKRVMIECGGKSPQIVFDDIADLESVVAQLAAAAFANSGQLCVAKSRLLVARPIAAEVERLLAIEVARHRPGDPRDTATRYGPIAFRRQYDRVSAMIAEAETAGLRRIGDDTPTAPPHAGGYYVQPTIFADVPANARLAQDEVFGPVLAMTVFDDEAQAVAIANDSIYGLSASVWTRDLGRAHRMIGALATGDVEVFPGVPHDGGEVLDYAAEPRRQSGFGVEGGVAGLKSYCATKSAIIHFG